MRNKWDQGVVSDIKKASSTRSNSNKWDFVNKPGKRELRAPQKHEKFYENLNSKVPALTDYPLAKTRKMKIKNTEPEDHLHELPKKDHHVNNIFLQSIVQRQL